MSLRDLDDRLVPRLAEKLTAIRDVFPKPPPPAGPLPVILRLRRLDDRWTAAGPLALVREVPQLGAFVLALVILVGGLTAFSRDEQGSTPAPNATTAPELPGEDLADGDDTLGPDIGQPVKAYLAETRKKLTDTAPGRPDGTVVAVVSFSGYQTPEEVRDLLGTSMQVHRVFFRLPRANAVIQQERVQDVVADTRRLMRAEADAREAEARNLLKQAATIENDPDQKRFDEQQAAQERRDAQTLRGRCRCVFAVVVRAQLRLLLDSQRVRAFRAIDISAPDADVDALRYTALTPEDKKTVTGGNVKNPG